MTFEGGEKGFPTAATSNDRVMLTMGGFALTTPAQISRFLWLLGSALALAGCDELVLTKNEVAKIAAAEASKAVAAEMAKRPAVQPSPVPSPEGIESRDKSHYQIVHPNPALAAMILLDTATGKTWRPCENSSLGRADLNGWCEM